MTNTMTNTVRIPVTDKVSLSIHQSFNGALETMPVVKNADGDFVLAGNSPRRFTNTEELKDHIEELLSARLNLWYEDWEGDE